uniref:Dynamin N-terminal domain-containing protein n=1 Tax=Sinocyclocheilus rhinocerous TaxID=307959 RepID=A0A673GY04_9TELE
MSQCGSSKGKSSGLNQHYEEKVRPCIDLVDSLRSLGVEKDLNLPAIAVIGDQSSGKSSVLEALSGVALPRGTGNFSDRLYCLENIQTLIFKTILTFKLLQTENFHTASF